MLQMLQLRTLACVCFVLLLVLAPYVCAQDADSGQFFTPADGVYVSESWIINNAVGGEFDDTITYNSGTSIYDVPDVDNGMGFGVALGVTGPGASGEIGYVRTVHDTSSTFPGIGAQEAAFNAIDFNLKIHLTRENRFRPYVLLGIGIPWITITDSEFQGGSSFDDETFVGISGNLGGGIVFYLTEQLFINAGAMYRFSSFGSVDGNDIERLYAGSPSFTVGMGFTF